eukprot:204193-Pelagomonas_calceolata.AAC.4
MQHGDAVHWCACESCGFRCAKAKKSLCPACNLPIDKVVNVYMSGYREDDDGGRYVAVCVCWKAECCCSPQASYPVTACCVGYLDSSAAAFLLESLPCRTLAGWRWKALIVVSLKTSVCGLHLTCTVLAPAAPKLL